MTTSSTPASRPATRHSAGAFDIRNVIGALLGIYGVLLLLAGFFLDPGYNVDSQQPKDATYNVWAGIALLIVAAVFFAWSKLRPIVVDEEALAAAQSDASSEGKKDY